MAKLKRGYEMGGSMNGCVVRHAPCGVVSSGVVHRVRWLALMVAVATLSPAMAEEKLDFSFLQGGTGLTPEMWESINGHYVPGQYLLDVVVNGAKPVKQRLEITAQEQSALCFRADWLAKVGLTLSPEYFKDSYQVERDCYVLSAAPSVTVELDVPTQTLTLGVPQIAQSSRPADMAWEYGHSALRFNYSANIGVNDVDTSMFGSADLNANLGRWVVNSTATASEESTDVSMFTATRAIQPWLADLSVGKTFVGEDLLGGTSIYGAMLASNNSMRANDLGYAPVFTGVANSNARVTLTQSGSTIYSEVVPPGPFAIRNVTLLSSGDVEMVITERDGSQRRQVFPLTVMSGMVTPGEYEFSVAAGTRDNRESDYGADGAVASLGYGYGFDNLTLRAGTLLHRDYQGVSGTLTTSLGDVGGVSLGGAWSRAKYDDGVTEQGARAQLSWNKTFTSTGTGVYASAGRRLSDQFTEFSSFSPSRDGGCDAGYSEGGDVLDDACLLGGAYWRAERVSRNEFSLGVSQSLGGRFNVGLTGWHRDYWREQATESGLSANLGAWLYGANVSLGGSLSQSRDGEGDSRNNWSASLSVSIPFTFSERRYSSFTTLTTGSQGGVGVNTGVSGSLNDRFSYSVGGGRDSDGDGQSNISASYVGDKVGTSASITQSGSGTTGSATITGSVLAVPAAGGVMLSRSVSDTVAVANIKDTPGVKFFSGVDRSDDNGNVVIPLTSYRQNTVTVDAGTLPQNVELGATSQTLVPTGRAVVYLPFETWTVHRYLLQVRQPDGAFVAGGTWAKDRQGTPLGFVAQNGVLLINAVNKLEDVQLGECVISAAQIKESERVQEVMCE
ncbi:fimbria/pilus outer membrane usher protein [Aeromonas veronii]